MITLGYKSKFSSILRACAAIAIGLVMICDSNSTETVVKIIACFLFASGLISLIYGLSISKKQTGSFQLLAVNAVVDVIIGLLLFMNPGWVASFIVYLIGIVLIGFGLLQLIVLSTTVSLLGGGFLSLGLSILAIIGGIFLVFNPLSIKLMSIFAGCFLIIYGAQELLSTWRVAKAVKEYEIRQTKTPEDASAQVNAPSDLSDAKEAEFEKVDDTVDEQ